MFKRKIAVLFFLIFIYSTVISQTKVDPSPINWYTIEQADSLSAKIPRPMFIDVYTEWCGWCKHMMQTTFANSSVANYINTNYYPVRFDAETFDTIVFKNKTYLNKGIGTKPKHELAGMLLNGQYSFPTIVYITKNNSMFQIPGFMTTKEIEPLLVWFAEEVNTNCSFEEWKYLFYHQNSQYYSEEIVKEKLVPGPDTTGKIHWISINDAGQMSLKDHKPVLIYFYTDWCLSCKLYTNMVLKDSVISNYINNRYHAVRFNAASQNNEILYGQSFSGNGINQPHQLAQVLIKQSFKFPVMVIINSDKQKLDEIHGFLTGVQTETVLKYFGTDGYKEKTFDNFMKEFKGKVIKRP